MEAGNELSDTKLRCYFTQLVADRCRAAGDDEPLVQVVLPTHLALHGSVAVLAAFLRRSLLPAHRRLGRVAGSVREAA